MMRSTVRIILALALGCLMAPRVAVAQQPVKGYRIGVLNPNSTASGDVLGIEGMRQGLRELGYVEGQNLTLELRWAEGSQERLAELGAELVRLPVDLIVAAGTAGAQAARHATTTLPIVAAYMDDPVDAGLVESLAHPGGNMTGLFTPTRELGVKRLELLKEALPGVTRVAVLLGAPGSATPGLRAALETTARDLGIALQLVEVHGPDDVERALSTIAHGQAEAVVVQVVEYTRRMRDFMVAQRLPTIGVIGPYLIAYGSRRGGVAAMWRRAAVFIDKILQGARPG